MNELSNQAQSIELLQQLGLKEYEARALVALSRSTQATAKEISEVSDIPRTRVYDAIRVLESKGLVEIQHSNPQQFRAVSIQEAVQTLRDEYEDRLATLQASLEDLDPVDEDRNREVTHEVWGLSGSAGITTRTRQLVDDAEREVILVMGQESVLDEELTDRLVAADRRGVDVIVGTPTNGLRSRVRDAIPSAEVFVSGLSWLQPSGLAGDETEISRLLLVDRQAILVSTRSDDVGAENREHGVFGRGFDNGIVTIVRRLMSTGLLPVDDPADEAG